MFLGAVSLLGVDWRATHHYAMIRRELELKGRPIPENGIWIAAFPMQYEYPLFTKDKHFMEIEGLNLKI